jgi:hypothetical protein
MGQSIQRLRYFDGEFLRSNDFSDEQSYHVAMRRLLNLHLHLSGIAYGLEIQQDANSVLPNGPFFFSINTGLAIDQLGREIVVSAPYQLSSDNILSRAGLQAGSNEVWIVYIETAAGLPAPGYQLCDQPGQNTRWTESFDIRLKLKGSPPSTPGTEPNTDLKGVLLGHVTLANDPINGWTITNSPNPDTLGRTYVGIRAQSIVAPDQIDGDTPHNFTDQKITTTPAASAVAPPGYLDVGGGPTSGPLGGPGVLIRGNIFSARNLVVGDDYLIQNTNPVGPAPTLHNPNNGNLKLNSDLFLNGKIYTNVNGNWVALSDLSLATPDIQLKTFKIDTSTGSGTATETVTTILPSFSTVTVQACISGFAFVLQADMETFLTKPAFPGHPEVLASATFQGRTPPQTANVNVDWSVGPGWVDASGTHYLVSTIDVLLIAIFRP